MVGGEEYVLCILIVDLRAVAGVLGGVVGLVLPEEHSFVSSSAETRLPWKPYKFFTHHA